MKRFILLLITLSSIFISSEARDEKEIEIRYRGGNGAYSDDLQWYIQIWDSWPNGNGNSYLEICIYELSDEEREKQDKRKKNDLPMTFSNEEHTPVARIQSSMRGANARGMKISWLAESKTFKAKQGDKISFTYNTKTHEYELTKNW